MESLASRVGNGWENASPKPPQEEIDLLVALDAETVDMYMYHGTLTDQGQGICDDAFETVEEVSQISRIDSGADRK